MGSDRFSVILKVLEICLLRFPGDDFSRKLSELGSRLGFGVQGLGRGLGAAAGRKWSFRVRRMSIFLLDGVPGPIPFPRWFQGGPRTVSKVFEVSSKGLKGIRKESK